MLLELLVFDSSEKHDFSVFISVVFLYEADALSYIKLVVCLCVCIVV